MIAQQRQGNKNKASRISCKTCNIVKVSSPLLDVLILREIALLLILISHYFPFPNNLVSLRILNIVKTSANTV